MHIVRSLSSALVCMLLLCMLNTSAESSFSNPLWDVPDPYAIKYDGAYYYTYAHKGNELVVSKSDSLTTRGTPKIVFTFPAGNWNSCALWGPFALFKWEDDHWYIYYCAVRDPNIELFGHERRVGVLRSKTDDPQGEYEDLSFEAPISLGDCWAIGAMPFKATDGKWYITFSGLKDHESMFPQCTYIAPMVTPWEIGERVLISEPEYDWEKSVQPIQEGQFVFVNGEKMFLLYSANASWTEKYCLGMLEYAGGEVASPKSWVKRPQPVVASTIAVRGPGGPCLIWSQDNTELYLLYHTTNVIYGGWKHRFTNLMRVDISEEGVPIFPIPTIKEKQPLPSGEILSFTKHYVINWVAGTPIDWIFYGGTWETIHSIKGARISVLQNAYSKAIADTVRCDNFDITTTVSIIVEDDDKSSAGLIFRASEIIGGEWGFRGYYVGISEKNDQVTLYRVDGAEATALASASYNIKRAMNYGMKVHVAANTIEVEIDGTMLLKAEDSTYQEGKMGIRAYMAAAKWGNISLDQISLN